jgi:hypothetical protein
MKKMIAKLGLFLIFSGGYTGLLLATELSPATPDENPQPSSTPTITEGSAVPIPVFLKDSEKIHDSENHSIPPSPQKNADGQPLQAQSSGRLPMGNALNNLSDSSVIPQIMAFNQAEDKSRAYYWHSLKDMDYCHFRSGSGNQWYGWQSGVDFLWALYRAGHFWWHDAYAGRWLYFDRGYWRWQGPKKNQFQVYLENGHYYACDTKGTLGDDLFTTGTEEEVTQPVVKETVIPLSKQKEDNPSPQGSMEESGRNALDSLNHH